MSADLLALDSELQPYARALVDAAGVAGLLPQVTSTLRSHSEQRRLYDRYLRGESAYPAAPPGTSAHEYGFAFDMVVTPYSALADVGYTWKTWGGKWSPHDAVHFEYPGWSKPPEVFREVRTLVEWINELPAWVQFLLPTPLMLAKNKPITREEALRILGLG